MNTDLADHTWIVGSGDSQALVIGSDYASPEGTLEFKQGGNAIVYNAKGLGCGHGLAGTGPCAPRLANWQTREGAAEALPQTSTAGWPASKEPQPMELYDAYENGWGWYRTTIHRAAAGDATLQFTGAGDVIRLFLNGQRVAGDKNGATLSLQAGDNELASLSLVRGPPEDVQLLRGHRPDLRQGRLGPRPAGGQAPGVHRHVAHAQHGGGHRPGQRTRRAGL